MTARTGPPPGGWRGGARRPDEHRPDEGLARPGGDPAAGPARRPQRRRRAHRGRLAGRLRRGRRGRERADHQRQAADRRNAARRRDRRRRQGHDRRAPAHRRHGHHAGVEPLRAARRAPARLRRARDAARRVDRARHRARPVDGAAQAGHRVPQRQDGHRRRRHLLAAADHRPQGPEGRRGLHRLRRGQGPQEGRRAHGADPVAVRQRRVPRRPRPVLQRDRADRLRPEVARRHRRVQVRELHRRRAERLPKFAELLGEGQAATSTSW